MVLVLIVTKGSAEGQVAVDAIIADKMPRLLNTGLLKIILRLVVFAETLCVAFAAEHGATVSGVGAEYLLRRDEDDARSRSGVL